MSTAMRMARRFLAGLAIRWLLLVRFLGYCVCRFLHTGDAVLHVVYPLIDLRAGGSVSSGCTRS